MTKRRIAASISLSLCFVVVYGWCNAFTAGRSDVGTFYFEWERFIPLIPVFIIPYMSIDLFFVAAPFLCKSKKELNVFVIRILLSICIAAYFFLILPLRFGFTRPQVEGLFGAVFRLLHGFDQPYNLFPSLHIILRTILADVYSRHTRGALNVVVRVWFSLIGLSTLFTFQHHVSDVIGGFVVAFGIMYAVPYVKEKTQMEANPRIGFYFAGMSSVCLILSILYQPLSLLFLWPAISCFIIALGYWQFGPAIFRKINGEIAWSARFILFPYFLGQAMYLKSYCRRCNRWDEIIPNLLIGRKLSVYEAEEAIAQGVVAVLDLTAEFDEAKPFRDVHYLNVQTMDLTAPTIDNLERAIVFIGKHIEEGKVYVHCKIGYSRSVAVVAAFLIKSNQAQSIEVAIAIIRKKRPTIVVRPEVMGILISFSQAKGFRHKAKSIKE